MRAGDQRGFAYPVVLLALVLFGLGLALAGTAWSEQARRDKEAELMRIGALYAHAIGAYYAMSPGSAKTHPKRLEDLLEDTRFVGLRRHLRTLYPDPVTGLPDWGLVRADDGGIVGVFSLSDAPPLKTAPFDSDGIALPAAMSYRDWKFVAPEPTPTSPRPTGA